MCAKLGATYQKKKKFKLMKELQRNFRKCILKNSQFFANNYDIKAKTMKMKRVKVGKTRQ